MKGRYRRLSFYNHRVELKIEGFQIGKLVDKARLEGIEFFKVIPKSDTEITCIIAKSDLKTLKKIAKSIYRISTMKENGAVYQGKIWLKSPVRVIGILLAAAIVMVQSMFIKEVEINGYKAIPEEELRISLREAGIYEGAYKPQIDWDKAKDNLYFTFPQITWVQLGYKGRLAVLNIEETSHKIYTKESKDSLQQEIEFNNIVAAETGYIESIHVWKGMAMVEEGDFVEKGQLLISGCVPLQPTTYDENPEESYLVNAAGEITAIVPYRLTFNQERYDWEGREKTEEELTRRAEQQLRAWAKENLPETAEITNKSLNFSANNNIIKAGVTIEVRREIGIIQEDIIGKDNSDTRRD